MPRWRERVPLESGLKLDLNHLIREEIIEPGRHTIWGVSFSDGSRARLEAETRPGQFACLKITHAGQAQEISLCSIVCNFGGRRWYFTCPRTHERVSVLWKPRGSPMFASRQAFQRQVAYFSQFLTPGARAVQSAQNIRRKLGGDNSPALLSDFPAKPKWMRWRTYERLLNRHEAEAEAALTGVIHRLARLQVSL
jgi:hypothetical protein